MINITGEHFEQKLEEISLTLEKAKYHFIIFWQLREALQRYRTIKSKYRMYFAYALEAHNDAFINSICKITYPDRDNKTSNFQYLKNYINSNPTIKNLFSTQEIQDMTKPIEDHHKINEIFKYSRDKYISHFDSDAQPEPLYPVYKKSAAELFINDLIKELNNIRVKFDGIKWHYEYIPDFKCLELVRCLKVATKSE